ncbi:MAG: hypothetical protein D6743_13640 [Calditrichaeota bacterium]|nr:MAG: hypothetical protein D6743_13640 [Calditrichota bacterium]
MNAAIPSARRFVLRALSAALVVGLLSVTQLFAQSQNLPLDHWAYRFLDRLETKGLYVSRDYSTRPYSREAIAEIILQIDASVKEDPSRLSRVEAALFEQLKGEFYEELAQTGRPISVQKKEQEPHLFRYEDEKLVLRWDALAGEQSRVESKRKVDPTIPKSLFYWGGSFRAEINRSMAIFADARSFILSDTDSLSNTVFNPSLGLPVTRKALVDVAVTDNASAYAVFRLPWFDLEAGRDLVEWGPGLRGTLLLSRNANFYDLFKLTFRFRKFKFEYLHGFLNADSTRYIVGHRLELRPWRNLQFAFNETVVYGDRSVEPLYLNPFVPFIIAERHLGNRDNNLLSFDFTWFLPEKRMKFYGEFLFDDFSLAKSLFGSFGNKWGVLVGSYWVDPLGLHDTDLRVELIRIQPFVYSHRNPVNTYANYNNSLGHWLGPDSDDWYVEVRHQFSRDLELGVSWEQRRRGQNDLNFGTRPADGKVKFLDGVVERTRFYGLIGRWQLRRDLFLTTTYHFIQSKNLRRRPEFDQDNHRLLVTFSLNY